MHKERRTDLLLERFPANHYVMIDDRPQLLAAMKRVLVHRVTTAFVRQGHCASESDALALDPVPDLAVAHIGDLCDLTLPDLYAATVGRTADTDRHRKSEAHYQEQP